MPASFVDDREQLPECVGAVRPFKFHDAYEEHQLLQCAGETERFCLRGFGTRLSARFGSQAILLGLALQIGGDQFQRRTRSHTPNTLDTRARACTANGGEGG